VSADDCAKKSGRRSTVKHNGLIADFIAGEDFRLSNQASWELLKRDKAIKEDRDFGRANRGITIVVL